MPGDSLRHLVNGRGLAQARLDAGQSSDSYGPETFAGTALVEASGGGGSGPKPSLVRKTARISGGMPCTGSSNPWITSCLISSSDAMGMESLRTLVLLAYVSRTFYASNP